MTAAHYNLGMAYLNQGRRQLALGQYEILRGLETESADALFENIYPESTQ
jgi:hypothetical protein